MSEPKVYYGKNINVMFNSEICIHSGVCVKGFPSVFNLSKRPWVDPDAATAEEIAQHIDKCPSKALTYQILEGESPIKNEELNIPVVEHDLAHKRFLIRDQDAIAAEMTYVTSSPELYIIDHTLVDPAYRGQGLGDKLVDAMVVYARENGIKILPLCPFAKGRFEHYSEYWDVLHK
ncbi:GNAT family N-acetyltransferase [Paenibacillus apii]|uniref:GNAT family N-acetyltransferase n=1 Tax=Paenibacillus apii TaxID=1850370 RepID=UPI0038B32801